MRIGALSRATGVDIETIRFYEKTGLLPGPARSENGYRDYAQAHLERLAFIRHGRALDMSLADIGLLLASLNSRDPAQLASVDGLVDAQLARVRARLISMRALEQQLVALKSRCDGQHAQHGAQGCGILGELVAAAHGEACACHGDVGAASPAPRQTVGLKS
ncbi:Cd(II)/Pb(II)-responsive transcriptional regulator [Roseateles oligotrophus]|uniref:Cd(II)/Pb(II)-responsive transcriptional regulator n=1 Tax=Roseateles oligotrophus TaxID=1769250 RepID=A0ABT2YM73_9BURK|nr:Cd(II)/Pb(II)-responsive transcriptional regulator [Roseateles oligotrophus]MCV2371169.1 Cd(II)/Pb(II)-responsive transcriptional regulator [Roseateles oligotrophus]